MIWVGGRIVDDDALRIDARDRVFEHGLGLFETLRTWGGRAPLLGRHLARLNDSARMLGIPLDLAALPDDGSVSALLRADGVEGDAVLRITLTGGLSEFGGATLWMRTAPLPAPMRHWGALVDLGPWEVAENDRLAQHKTLNYWSRRRAHEMTRRAGYDEVLSLSPDGSVWEGSRTNLFLVEGDRLVTPRRDGPIVPGIMRELVIDLARGIVAEVSHFGRTQATVDRDRLMRADEVFLTNSVRGIVPVARIGDRTWPSPGDWTRRISILVHDRLRRWEEHI